MLVFLGLSPALLSVGIPIRQESSAKKWLSGYNATKHSNGAVFWWAITLDGPVIHKQGTVIACRNVVSSWQ